ncbi:TlpA family protein disulfide reductase [Colwelliaceae bacterium 6441]
MNVSLKCHFRQSDFGGNILANFFKFAKEDIVNQSSQPRFSYSSFIIICLFLCLFYQPVKASNLPEKLLTLPITLLSGEVITLKALQGKKSLYLKFWATWCVPCQEQMPHFEQIHQRYQDDLMVIAINLGLNDDLAEVLKSKAKFGLSMPLAIDKSGDLAQAFRLKGTPYHLLFDQQMNLVHIGHKANSVLDNKIALISQQGRVDLMDSLAQPQVFSEPVIKVNDDKLHALYFSATWCDWYLKDARSATAKQCVAGQNMVNDFSQTFNNMQWQGVISRLWTGEPELAQYVKKYKIMHSISIDTSNQLFHHYGIKNLPRLVIVKNGTILFETANFSDQEKLKAQLSLL